MKIDPLELRGKTITDAYLENDGSAVEKLILELSDGSKIHISIDVYIDENVQEAEISLQKELVP